MDKRALVILVGITANRSKRAALTTFFTGAEEYDVFVPKLPQRLGLDYCVRWFRRYLSATIIAAGYRRVDYINYISGGLIFRHAIAPRGDAAAGRLVFIRGPVQERVPAVLVQRYGRFLTWLLFGRMVLDLAAADLGAPPLPDSLSERGLIIEGGVSRLAGTLGLAPDALPAEAWQPARLLPGAADWRRVPESHDAVYESPAVLSLALGFLRHGRFPEAP